MSAPWTVLLYATATKQEEEDRLQRAISQLRPATRDGAARVVVQLYTRAGVWRIRLRPEGDERATIARCDFSDPCALRDLLDAEAPDAAAPLALVLFGHGSGLDRVWRGGGAKSRSDYQQHLVNPKRLGFDPVSGRFLTNEELRVALASSRRGSVEVLAFNACSMMMMEIAHLLREVAPLQLGSQVDATIWPYDALAGALLAAPPPSAEQLARALLRAVQAELDEEQRRDTLSAVRSSELGPLVAAFQQLAAQALELFPRAPERVLAAVAAAQRVFDPVQGDLLSLTTRLGEHCAELHDASARVAACFAAACVGNAAHPLLGDLHGLSLFIPLDPAVLLEPPYDETAFEGSPWARLLAAVNQRLREP